MTVIQPRSRGTSSRSSTSASSKGSVFEILLLIITLPIGLAFMAGFVLSMVVLGGGMIGIVFLLVVGGSIHFVGEWTGLMTVWKSMVTQATAAGADPMGLASIFLQNALIGVAVGLVLAIPTIAATLKRLKLGKAASSIDGEKVSAFGMGLSCLALHVAIGALAATALSAVGLALPDGSHAVMSEHAAGLAQLVLGGGGWPPDSEALEAFGILLTVVALIAGVLGGVTAGGGVLLVSALTSGAAGAGTSAGRMLAIALTSGKEGRWMTRSQALWAGGFKGAATGLVYAVLLFGGAALFGLY